MALDEFLIGLLVDPVDHEPLVYVASKSVLYNPRRRVAYEVRGAIPVLLPDEGRTVDDAEHQALSGAADGVPTGTAARS